MTICSKENVIGVSANIAMASMTIATIYVPILHYAGVIDAKKIINFGLKQLGINNNVTKMPQWIPSVKVALPATLGAVGLGAGLYLLYKKNSQKPKNIDSKPPHTSV
jgi:hypothetical protein